MNCEHCGQSEPCPVCGYGHSSVFTRQGATDTVCDSCGHVYGKPYRYMHVGNGCFIVHSNEEGHAPIVGIER